MGSVETAWLKAVLASQRSVAIGEAADQVRRIRGTGGDLDGAVRALESLESLAADKAKELMGAWQGQDVIPCAYCEIVTADPVHDDVTDDEYCSLECIAEHRAVLSEESHKRASEAFYGGDGPASLEHQLLEAQKIKRGHR